MSAKGLGAVLGAAVLMRVCLFVLAKQHTTHNSVSAEQQAGEAQTWMPARSVAQWHAYSTNTLGELPGRREGRAGCAQHQGCIRPQAAQWLTTDPAPVAWRDI